MSVPEQPRTVATVESFEDRRRRRFLRAVNALRATWRLPAIVTIILAVLIVAAFMILRVVVPTATTTFISRVQFTFPNADVGRYPNYVRFTINELVDPTILDQVYNELELKRFGVSREEFYSAFSIRPFSPTEQEIVDSFRQQLADRRLTLPERERLEQQLRNRLEAASRGAAELSFTLPGPLVLPPEVGRAVVQRVPRVWAQTAIEKKGVLKIPGFTAVEKVIPEETIDRQSLPLTILTLIEVSKRLDDRLFAMRKIPGMETLRDDISGKSFRDLEWDVRDLQLFHINPLRAALTTYAFPKNEREMHDVLQQRISYLEIQEANATRQAQAIGESLAHFVDATSGLNRGAPERRSEQGAAGGTTIPQVSESFIDKIIELARASVLAYQNQTFITDRTNDQLELTRLANDYRGERNRWQEMLTAISFEGRTPKEPDEVTLARLAQQLRLAINETNAKWAALSRLEAEFAANRLSHTGEIYAPYLAGPDVIRFDPVFNRSAFAAAMSMLLIFFLGFWALLAALFIRRKAKVD